jgi:hypothetical protein
MTSLADDACCRLLVSMKVVATVTGGTGTCGAAVLLSVSVDIQSAALAF